MDSSAHRVVVVMVVVVVVVMVVNIKYKSTPTEMLLSLFV
jgi:hypothetical protein